MSGKEFDLLSLGEILLRLSPPNNERIVRGDLFEKQVGGAELNVASGVSLMGLRSGIISRIPDSSIGIFAKNKIRFCGVSDDYLIYDKGRDARLGIYYYENGAYPRKPGVVYDRQNSSMTRIDIDEFDSSIYQSARCFHTSGITLALSEACRKTGVEMIKRFKEAGALISFDVNFRLNLWSGEEARKCIEGILPYVDIFFCSEDTARLTFGKEGDLKEIMESFAGEYPISVMASTQRTVHSPKVHSFTSVIYDAKAKVFHEEKPYENIEVVDRIGSGDAYVAGALYGLLSEDGCCEKALKYGNASSAAKNTIPGDMPSLNRGEIENIICDHANTGYKSEMNR
ncbi:MAG: sugar kinase [Eubacteriales bacterium]|nr:sugar kinase [Eubacteriales bacterium]